MYAGTFVVALWCVYAHEVANECTSITRLPMSVLIAPISSRHMPAGAAVPVGDQPGAGQYSSSCCSCTITGWAPSVQEARGQLAGGRTSY